VSQPRSEQEIEQLINRLHSSDDRERLRAVVRLGELGVRDRHVIAALEEMAAHEPLEGIVEAAAEALRRLGHPHPAWDSTSSAQRTAGGKQYGTSNEKVIDSVIGFVGWYTVNGAFWLTTLKGQPINEGYNLFANLLMLPVNLLVLIVLAFLRRWMAFGILVAVAANLLIALVLRMTTNATCTIPFFIK
jgi:hypothetical protein